MDYPDLAVVDVDMLMGKAELAGVEQHLPQVQAQSDDADQAELTRK